MSAFRPFLTPEPKRQGPRKDEELVIRHLIISGLTEIGHEAWPNVEMQQFEDTHTHTFIYTWRRAGFFFLFLSEQQTPVTFSPQKLGNVKEAVSTLPPPFKAVPFHCTFRLLYSEELKMKYFPYSKW